MEPNAWKGFFRSYVLGQWYCYIFNMILKNNNQDLNWYWNALWLSSHSFWKLRNCIQASKWKKSWVGVQVFACDVAVESDHVVIRNSRSQFKTTSSSRKSEGDFTPCGYQQTINMLYKHGTQSKVSAEKGWSENEVWATQKRWSPIPRTPAFFFCRLVWLLRVRVCGKTVTLTAFQWNSCLHLYIRQNRAADWVFLSELKLLKLILLFAGDT